MESKFSRNGRVGNTFILSGQRVTKRLTLPVFFFVNIFFLSAVKVTADIVDFLGWKGHFWLPLSADAFCSWNP